MHHSISDFVLDIVQNSIEAGADVITVDMVEDNDQISISVGDSGPGMDDETLRKITDPFYTDGTKHENRSVGLGVPFVMQAVKECNGDFDIRSEVGTGTSVFFSFKKSSIDIPPVGNIPLTALSMMIFYGEYELIFRRVGIKGEYSITRSQLRDSVGSLFDAGSAKLVRDYFESQESYV